MARQLSLSDGTTTINLIDEVNYDVMREGIEMPPPERKTVYGGDNPFRDGSDLINVHYGNRDVRIRLKLMGTTQDNLISAIKSLQSLLIKAEDAQLRRWGATVYLTYQWRDATNPVYLDVLEGELILPPNYMSMILDQNKTILDADLTLKCKPFARGAITVSHENYVANPSFEEGATVPGDNWTIENATQGTASFDTTNKKYGLRSVDLRQNNDGTSIYFGIRSDHFAVPTVASTGYIQLYGRHVGGVGLTSRIYDVTGTAYLTYDTFSRADSAWEKRGATFTKPAGCVLLNVLLYFADYGAGTAQVDGIYLKPDQSTAPDFWISGRKLIDHKDRDAGHLNYFDIEDVPGDVPAGMRLTSLSGEVSQRYRANPYNYTHIYEAEAGTTFYYEDVLFADALMSGGTALLTGFGGNAEAGWRNRVRWGTATNLIDKCGHFRAFCAYRLIPGDAADGQGGTITYGLRLIQGWTGGSCIGGSVTETQTRTFTCNYAGTRHWVDLGVFEVPPEHWMPRDGTPDHLQWTLQDNLVLSNGIGNLGEIDNLHFAPLENRVEIKGPNVLDSISDPPGAFTLGIPGDDTSTWTIKGGTVVGNIPTIQPNRTNRFIWRDCGGTSGGTIATIGTVRAKIEPRYIHIG